MTRARREASSEDAPNRSYTRCYLAFAMALCLLMALFGAVILARKQIELGEDERRGLAGMRRLTVEGEAGGAAGGAR